MDGNGRTGRLRQSLILQNWKELFAWLPVETLGQRMQDDPKCTAKMDVQLSVLPSYTRLGMASLFPHSTLTMTDDYQVLADDVLCDSLAGRQTVLQKHEANGVCVQVDAIKGLKKNELRDIFSRKTYMPIERRRNPSR